jgi:hypothetical protein
MMKAIVRGVQVFVVAVLLVWASTPAAAQAGAVERGRLRLDSLDLLQPKASGHVVVDVDAGLLKFATAVLSDSDDEEREVKRLVAGLRGVFVRSYEFKFERQYTDADLTALRSQLRGPGWSRIVDVKTGEGGDADVELYLATEAGRVEGLALVSAEPRKITIVNIVGAIDLEKLRKLEGSLGIPKLRIEGKTRGAASKDEKGTTRRP